MFGVRVDASSAGEMRAIHGVGETKMRRYSDQFLAAILSFVDGKNQP